MRDFLKHWSPRVETAETLRQSGALPYSIVEGRVAFLLITSRRGGKWIFPKGAIEPNMTAWDSAALEAQEEAGVIGEISPEKIGSYRTGAGGDNVGLVDVDLYPLRVTRQLDEYKEQGERMRHWATLSEARRLLADQTMGRLALTLHNRLLAS
jgi:8-oxo-dGTP pyrophosphatase MutT (NUDIX family)